MGLIFTVISNVIDMHLQANDRIFVILTKRGEAQTRHLMPSAVNYLSPIRECVSMDLCAVVFEAAYQKHCEGNNLVILDYILNHLNVFSPFINASD